MTRRAAVVVEAVSERPVGRRQVEMVERKGIGHPDTICDSLVESIAVALNRMYHERLGMVAHYNVDKALLVAGQSRKWFGGGEVTRPVERDRLVGMLTESDVLDGFQRVLGAPPTSA